MSLDLYYDSFSQKRADEHWKNLSNDLEQYKKGIDFKFDVSVNTDALGILSDPKYSKVEGEVLHALRQLDLAYGSVRCWPMESIKCEFAVVGSLAQAVGVPYENGYITKEDLITLFKEINQETVLKAVPILNRDLHWDDNESKSAIMEWLGNVRPVALDLKDNEDTIFINEVNGEIAPDSADELLKKRVKDHHDQFAHLFG